MAAYAAVVTLMNLMDDIQNHPRLSTSLDNYQIESLREKIGFFLDFLESSNSHGRSNEAEDVESQIASAAHVANDVIEPHIVNQIHAGSYRKSHGCLLDLQNVIVGMDSIKDKVMEVKEKWGFKEKQPPYSMPATSSRRLPTGKTTMVGFDDELHRLMDVLTRQESSLEIISISGMGGIGKTTLAKNVYEHPIIVHHFDIRAWTTVSQDYSAREILLELLSCKEKSAGETDNELGDQLYKRLCGRRYLIILDDVWSSEVWDEIKFFFPDNGNGNEGRIVITTRQSNMASRFSSSPFVMNFLNEDKSWKLFCEKAFGKEDCPPELVKIGKKIVEKCEGLPLSIVVIGGHLGKSSRTKENWETFAKDIKPILNSGEGEQCLSILSLSYSYLPAYLKPCFLYMGIFPEDDEIDVSELIKLWVAEGFLKPNKDQSLEEVAMGCLNDLVDRNLILDFEWGGDGKIVKMHDLLRELCSKVAKREKFLCVRKVHVWKVLGHTPEPINRERRVAIHGYDYSRCSDCDDFHGIFDALKSAPLVRSLMRAPGQLSRDFKLLKILTFGDYSRDKRGVICLEAQFQRVNLRYLQLSLYTDQSPYIYLPSSISLLWNLQTLIINIYWKPLGAPSEIWEMPQLRHVEVSQGIHLPDPPSSDRLDQQDNLQDNFVLCNLQTLNKVINFRLSEEVCKRIPNIKELGIRYDSEAISSSEYCLHNLGHFRKLETLFCIFGDKKIFHALKPTFPISLRELCLSASLHWEDLTMIGSLPHLEILDLSGFDVIGPEWNPVEGGFPRLKYLFIECSTNLETWNADRSHFPVLETLHLGRANKLAEIPSGIGEISTLQCIKLDWCSMSVAISAMRILVEQEQELENPNFLLEIWGRTRDNVRFMEMVEEEGLSSKNLRLHDWNL